MVEIPLFAEALAFSVNVLVEVVELVPSVAVTPAGRLNTIRFTGWSKPPEGSTVMVVTALPPGVIDTGLGAALSVKFPSPVTVRAIVMVSLKEPDVPVIVTEEVPVVAVALAVKVSVLLLVAGLALNTAVTPAGNPDAANVTLGLSPLAGVIVIVVALLVCCATLTLAGLAERVNAGATVS